MLIAKIRRNATGAVLVPTESSLRMTLVLLNTDITVDAGHWHRIKVAGYSDAERKARLEYAFDVLQSVPGAAIWQQVDSVMDSVDGRQHHISDIIYCVQ